MHHAAQYDRRAHALRRRRACRRTDASPPGTNRSGGRTARGPWRTRPRDRARATRCRADRRAANVAPRSSSRVRASAPPSRRAAAAVERQASPSSRVRSIAGSRGAAARRSPSRTRRRRRARPRRRPTARTAPARRGPTRRTRARRRASSRSTQRVVAGRGERVEREHRRHERRGRGVPAELLAQHRDLDRAEPDTAARLGDLDAEPALVGHRRPQRARRTRRRSPCGRAPAPATRGRRAAPARRHAARAGRRRGRSPSAARVSHPGRPSRSDAVDSSAHGTPTSSSSLDAVRPRCKEPRMAEAPAKLSWNGKEIELPVVRGTEDECAIDISKLRAQTGLDHPRLRLREHRRRPSRRSRSSTATPASSATAATTSRTLAEHGAPVVPRDLVPAHLRRAADRGRARRVQPPDPQAHAAARRREALLRRLPEGRAPDGDARRRWSARCRPSTRTAKTRTIPSRCSSRSSG